MARMLDVALYWGTSMHNKNKAAAAAFRTNRTIHMMGEFRKDVDKKARQRTASRFMHAWRKTLSQ